MGRGRILPRVLARWWGIDWLLPWRRRRVHILLLAIYRLGVVGVLLRRHRWPLGAIHLVWDLTKLGLLGVGSSWRLPSAGLDEEYHMDKCQDPEEESLVRKLSGHKPITFTNSTRKGGDGQGK